MEGSPYQKFSFSRGKGAFLRTGSGVLRSGEPGFLLAGILRTRVPSNGDPEAGALPGEGSNLNYVTMAVDEQNEQPKATQREAEPQSQLDGLQSQVTELHTARGEEPDKEAPEGVMKTKSLMTAYLEQMFSKRLDAMQSIVEMLPGVAPPIRKSNLDSYTDNPFTGEITLVEIPRKFPFPSIKAYDGTSDLDGHIAQYRQRMLTVALPKESRKTTMCKGFGSTLLGPALQWYINLPSRSISSFATLNDKFVEQFTSNRDLEKTSDGLYKILQHRAEPLRGYLARFNQEKVGIPECNIHTAIAFKRGMLPDGNLYKELTKYQCKTMEDMLS
ncbi:hypothetical protein DY000_02016209 [Brassica cretica]|uniref:Retrotransposon gag domain-containing protein n=1 Tax=Brassica cretica TaxID=69181 RepID=A0ABQ7D8V3_BRACR|nr:hypothetical protein DY000_02016209 [Brassica cretica]